MPSTDPPQPLKLLLVDDDVVDRLSVSRLLSQNDRTLLLSEADSVASALELTASKEHDCALVDYYLPDGTALDFIRAAAKQSPGLPIVVLTGNDDEDVAMAALHQGAQDYLIKGTRNARDILRAVRYAIQRRTVADLQRRLLHADRLAAIGQLSAGVAHEINNPLTYIVTNYSFLEQRVREISDLALEIEKATESSFGGASLKPRAEPRKSALRKLRAECDEMLRESLIGLERIRAIVMELRVFSRLDQDTTELIDMNDIIESACKMVSNEIRHRAELIKNLKPLPLVTADRNKLLQVMTNVLLNAAQAIDTGSAIRNQIRIATVAEDRRLLISVEDTGRGITPHDMPHVFRPFFTTKRADQGTGLGLSICQQIVHRHGGEMRITSHPGAGTRVFIELPIETGITLPPPNRHRHTKNMEKPNTRILVIDDDPLVCKAYQRVLTPHHRVVLAHGGREGLSVLEQDSEFDVIICDLMMPDIDGPSVYKALQSSKPDLLPRLVFASGGIFTDRVDAFIQSVPNRCLPKPITRAQLLDLIDSMVSPANPEGGGKASGIEAIDGATAATAATAANG